MWLDCDTIVTDSLQELWIMDLRGKSIAAAQDCGVFYDDSVIIHPRYDVLTPAYVMPYKNLVAYFKHEHGCYRTPVAIFNSLLCRIEKSASLSSVGGVSFA